MSDADILALVVIFLCLLGSTFFSGSETAITSFGERKAVQLKEEGGRDSRVIALWVERPVFVLTTILLGNNITNTLMGATATALAIRLLSGSEQWSGWAVPMAVVLTTGLLLVFGEIVPKALGRLYSRRVAIPALRVLDVLSKIAYPIVWLLTRLTKLVIGRAIVNTAENAPAQITSNELDFLIRLAEREGAIPAEQAALHKSIFRFEDKIVRDILVPVDRLTAVDRTWSLNRIKSFAQATGHSRLPVYAGDVDHIVGILHIKQIVGIDADNLEDMESVLRPPLFVSESLLIHDLLHRFKEMRVHLAIVVDDGGNTVGVVTLEDVLEQIVGQIFDETDRAPRGLLPETVAGLHYFDGQDSIDRVEELLECELEEFEGVDSIGDLLSRLAGQMPVAGSIFVLNEIRLKVLAADAKRVIRVSAEKIEEDDGDHD